MADHPTKVVTVPLYDFFCSECGATRRDVYQTLAETTSSITCSYCSARARKVLSFPGIKVFREHYNPSVGAHITSHAQFKSELSRASDAATARTGIPHNFQPIDHTEAGRVLGVSDEGVQSTYDAEVRLGKREPKRYL